MGLVTQDSILFNDNIKNNIKLGMDNVSDDQIIEATKIANAYEFISDKPEGLDHNIGDSGGKLSGGQKQRLSIARAVLKNPPIMILDEATSALDTESEKIVQVALENMMKNRTSVCHCAPSLYYTKCRYNCGYAKRTYCRTRKSFRTITTRWCL